LIPIGQIDRTNLDLHRVRVAQSFGELVEKFLASGNENQRIAARREFSGQRRTYSGRRACDDRAAVRSR
jgi:hypothetical protein